MNVNNINPIFFRCLFAIIFSGLTLILTAQTVTYTESFEDFMNPDRGFYHPVHANTSNFESLDAADLQSKRTTPFTPYMGNYSVRTSLIYRQYVLDNFKNSNLSSTFLNQLQNDFNIARQAGVKLIVRFAYTEEEPNGGCGAGHCYGDVPKARILGHIAQLKPYLQANPDVISVVQSGFIGIWGEQYYTDYFGDASEQGQGQLFNANWIDRNEVLGAILDAVPTNRMVQVRYPQLKQRYIYGVTAPVTSPAITAAQAHNGSDIARIGFHNDCFLSSPDDYGTYFDYGNDDMGASNQIAILKPYFAEDGKYTCVGGETCNNPDFDPQNDCSGQAIQDMAYLHYSFLNSDYENEVNNDWQTGGCMDEIKRRLGYRFVMLNGTYPATANTGQSLNFTLQLKNVGFAAPFNPRVLQLVFRHTTTNTVYKVTVNGSNTDSRFWHPGNISLNATVTVPSSMPDGNYELLLHLLDNANNNAIANRPEYSIRFANTNTWENNTGYNKLNHTINITSPSQNCISIDGSYDDWSSIAAVSTSGSGGLNTLKAGDDNNSLYLFAASVIGAHYQFYLDTDNNASGSNEFTGSNWSNMGFNYLLEDGNLFQYTGTGTNWSWSEVGTVEAVKNSSGVEVRINKSQLTNLGSTIRIGFVSLDANWNDIGQIPSTNSGASYALTSGLNCDCNTENLVLSGNLNSSEHYETNGTIESSQNISGNTVVEYDSKISILLKPGFYVANGVNFHAYIEGCDPTSLTDEIYALTNLSSQKNVIENFLNQELVFSVFPNPFEQNFTINYKITTANFYSLTIYNALGESVADPFSRQWQEAGFVTFTVEVPSVLPNGLYWAVLNNHNSIWSKKVIKNSNKN